MTFRLEDGRRKDGGGSGEGRVTRSILPPATKTLLFLLRSFSSHVRVSIPPLVEGACWKTWQLDLYVAEHSVNVSITFRFFGPSLSVHSFPLSQLLALLALSAQTKPKMYFH